MGGAHWGLTEMSERPAYEKYSFPHNFTEADFDQFVISVSDDGASDITLQSGDFAFGEFKRRLVRVSERVISHTDMTRILDMKYGPTGTGLLGAGKKIDFDLKALRGDDLVVYRANVVRCRVAGGRGMSLTLRPIPAAPLTLDQLGIESELRDLFFPRYGLIFVVGTTGSGKTTLLAATLRERAEKRPWDPVKIGTIEDPVEFSFKGLGRGVMPEISQIQLGEDITHYPDAASAAMRRKLHVIVMGEVRDQETAHLAMELAETGHNVLATMHVDEPQQAIERMVSFYPTSAGAAIASKLKANLRLIVAQKLTTGVKGDVVAIRSWLEFNEEFKEQLGELPHHQWEAHAKRVLRERKLDMRTRAAQKVRDGAISLRSFCEVTSMSTMRATEYLREEGIEFDEQ